MASQHSPNESTSAQQSSGAPISNRVFATTSWSMVLRATDKNDSEATIALNSLCEVYWYPLYAFARQKGKSHSEAEDATQAFIFELIESSGFAKADQKRGRFRTFLLASFTNFMTNQWRANQAQKRGGGDQTLSLDFESGDGQYSLVASNDLTPERIFERTWAMTVLKQSLEQVKTQYDRSGKPELFSELQVFLGGTGDATYTEVAERLGMKANAVKVAVHRLRQRYGEQLRIQIGRTVDSSSEVDEELQTLFQILGAS